MKKRVILMVLLMFVLQCLPFTASASDGAKYDPYRLVNWDKAAKSVSSILGKTYGAVKGYFTPTVKSNNTVLGSVLKSSKSMLNNLRKPSLDVEPVGFSKLQLNITPANVKYSVFQNGKKIGETTNGTFFVEGKSSGIQSFSVKNLLGRSDKQDIKRTDFEIPIVHIKLKK